MSFKHSNFVLLFVLVLFVMIGPRESRALLEKREFDLPRRERSIIVSEDGFFPSNFAVFVGERVRFFVTSTEDQKSCFYLPDKKLFLSANKGEISEGEVYFDKTGIYRFFCPIGRIEGKIRVMARKKITAKKVKRKIASKEMFRMWMPKDYSKGN